MNIIIIPINILLKNFSLFFNFYNNKYNNKKIGYYRN